MDDQLIGIAQSCLDAAEGGTMAFPEIVATLMRHGFESYAVDYRRATVTYYLPDGDSVVLSASHGGAGIAEALDTDALQAAIREAQADAPGYSYAGFCAKAMAAGCAGYLVSFSGRRAVYFGRMGETHVEHFPS